MNFLAPDNKTGLNSVADIPIAWRNALSNIQMLIPEAVMAGGCLRDRDNGVAVKDIDIFVPAVESRASDATRIAEWLVKEGWKDVEVPDARMYPVGCDTRVIGVVEARYVNCPPIQIVVGEWDMANLFSHFDFGICQISYDGREIKRSQHYRDDRLLKMFTIVTERSDEAFVCSINRWARLKEKYPTWTFNLGTRRKDYASGGTVSGRMSMSMPGVTSFQQASRLARYARDHPLEQRVMSMLSSRDCEVVLQKSAAARILQRVPSAQGKTHPITQKIVVTAHPSDRPLMVKELVELARRDPSLLRP